MTSVGFVGAGQMGRPMVERLVAAGHEVSLFARREGVRRALALAGARIVATPRQAAEGSEVVVACLFSDPQLVEVAEGPDGLVAGLAPEAVLVSHVTGHSATIRDLAGRAEARSAHVLDGPVSGTADDIRAGKLTVLLGGDPAAVGRAATVVGAYADRVIPTGGLGTALAVKLVNNLLFTANIQLAASAIHLGRQFGIDQDLLLSALAECSGASYAAGSLTRFSDPEQFAEIAGPFLRKDVAACRSELAATATDGGLLFEVVQRGPVPSLS